MSLGGRDGDCMVGVWVIGGSKLIICDQESRLQWYSSKSGFEGVFDDQGEAFYQFR